MPRPQKPHVSITLQQSRPICVVFTHATASKAACPRHLVTQPAHMRRIHTCHGLKSCMSPSPCDTAGPYAPHSHATALQSRMPRPTKAVFHWPYKYSIIHLAPPRQESSLISGPANAVPRDLSSPVS